MAVGANSNPADNTAVLQSILDRLAKLERPISTHIGPVGGSLTGSATIGGWTFSVASDGSGNLLATSDSGTQVVLASP